MYTRYSIVPAQGHFVVKKFEDLQETYPHFTDWCQYLGLQEYALIAAHNLARAIVASNAFKIQFFAADEGMDGVAFEALLNGMGYGYINTTFDLSILQTLLDDPESRPPEGRLVQVVADVARVCGPRDEFSMEGMRQPFAEKK